MGRLGRARPGRAGPETQRSARRDGGDARLDPVRWSRAGRGTLIRLAAVAILLATAAVLAWSPSPGPDRPVTASTGAGTGTRTRRGPS